MSRDQNESPWAQAALLIFFYHAKWHSIYNMMFHEQFLIWCFVCLVTLYASRNPQLLIFSSPVLPSCRRRIGRAKIEAKQIVTVCLQRL